MKLHTPLGSLGESRDIANAYLWLASDEASFVHGATISVDGGIVIGTKEALHAQLIRQHFFLKLHPAG